MAKKSPDGAAALDSKLRGEARKAKTGPITVADDKPEKKKPKKVKEKADWSTPESTRRQTSILLKEQLHAAQQEFGDPYIMVAGEIGRLVLGIPLPSFSLEYLFQSNVLPFGRVTQLVGKEGTYKSGMACEMARWFIVFGGGTAMLAEHESKYSPDWPPSIIGWEHKDLFHVWPCRSINDWQQRILWYIRKNEKTMAGTAKEPGPGMVYPFFMIVDSLFGKLMQSTKDKIEKAGSAGPGHPVEAGSITRYLQGMTDSFYDLPTHLLLVNHLKSKQDPNNPSQMIRSKAGGAHKDFQETHELEMQKGKQIHTADYDGHSLYLQCAKNSLGTTRRRIPVSIYWWEEPDPEHNFPDGTPKWRQTTVWNWNASSIELLLSLEGSDGTKAKKIVDLCKPAGKTAIYSKALGIKDSAPVDFNTAGEILHNNYEVMQNLREAFGIKIWTVWQPGIDYATQRGFDKKAIAKLGLIRRKREAREGRGGSDE